MESNPNSIDVSVVIPTFQRAEEVTRTLRKIADCDPRPKEIIVHVDGGDRGTANDIRTNFSAIKVLESDTTLGPGGSRNRLLNAAENEIVISLDDDSFPIDRDFFKAAAKSIGQHPDAGIIAMHIIHDDEPIIDRSLATRVVADFVGCGCVYRKSAFLETGGYVPVQPAYGVEEADLTLQLREAGWLIVFDENLRVRHATSRSHQATAMITAAHISNLALLAFLRYPARYWLLGFAQVANRLVWSLCNARYRGIGRGILSIPIKFWEFRSYRRPVSPSTIGQLAILRGKTS